jgi:hypothetical protein
LSFLEKCLGFEQVLEDWHEIIFAACSYCAPVRSAKLNRQRIYSFGAPNYSENCQRPIVPRYATNLSPSKCPGVAESEINLGNTCQVHASIGLVTSVDSGGRCCWVRQKEPSIDLRTPELLSLILQDTANVNDLKGKARSPQKGKQDWIEEFKS